MVNLHSILSKAVKTGMSLNELTQRALAQKVGISEKHLSLILNGKATGSIEVWDALLKESGAKIGWKVDNCDSA